MGRPQKFSIDNFKNWLSKQDGMDNFFSLSESDEVQEDPRTKFLGRLVEAKVSREKIEETIEVDSGTSDEVIKEFMENGGTISDIAGRNLFIEVANGSFYLPRFCVKVLK